jgi:hypothetical protein
MTLKNLTHIGATAIMVAGMAAGLATNAVAQTTTQEQVQDRDQDRIYGSQFMTPQERTEYMNRMRSAKTEQERETLRLEHYKRMQDRARDKGVTLPNDPPKRAGSTGSGPGMNPGTGMAPGGGMGPGGKAR